MTRGIWECSSLVSACMCCASLRSHCACNEGVVGPQECQRKFSQDNSKSVMAPVLSRSKPKEGNGLQRASWVPSDLDKSMNYYGPPGVTISQRGVCSLSAGLPLIREAVTSHRLSLVNRLQRRLDDEPSRVWLWLIWFQPKSKGSSKAFHRKWSERYPGLRLSTSSYLEISSHIQWFLVRIILCITFCQLYHLII